MAPTSWQRMTCRTRTTPAQCMPTPPRYRPVQNRHHQPIMSRPELRRASPRPQLQFKKKEKASRSPPAAARSPPSQKNTPIRSPPAAAPKKPAAPTAPPSHVLDAAKSFSGKGPVNAAGHREDIRRLKKEKAVLKKPAAASKNVARSKTPTAAPDVAEPDAKLIDALQEGLRAAGVNRPWQASTAEVRVVKMWERDGWIHQLRSDGKVWGQTTSNMFGVPGAEKLASALMHLLNIGHDKDTFFSQTKPFSRKSCFH